MRLQIQKGALERGHAEQRTRNTSTGLGADELLGSGFGHAAGRAAFQESENGLVGAAFRVSSREHRARMRSSVTRRSSDVSLRMKARFVRCVTEAALLLEEVAVGRHLHDLVDLPAVMPQQSERLLLLLGRELVDRSGVP